MATDTGGISYPTDHRRGMALAAVGVFVLSFDALLVRLTRVDPATIIFWRGLFIGTSLTLVLALLQRRWLVRDVVAAGWLGAVLAVGFGLTQILFVTAVTTTRVANVVVILCATPLFAAGLSGVFLREWIAPRTWLAIGLCILGIVTVFGGSLGRGEWVGDALALAAALVVAGNFTALRRTPWLSRLTVVGAGGFVACLLSLPLAQPTSADDSDLAVLVVMGLLQMPLAQVLLTQATRHLPSAEVSLFLIGETVLGTYWVWLILGEQPPGATLAGGVLVVATLAGHAWLTLRRR